MIPAGTMQENKPRPRRGGPAPRSGAPVRCGEPSGRSGATARSIAQPLSRPRVTEAKAGRNRDGSGRGLQVPADADPAFGYARSSPTSESWGNKPPAAEIADSARFGNVPGKIA